MGKWLVPSGPTEGTPALGLIQTGNSVSLLALLFYNKYNVPVTEYQRWLAKKANGLGSLKAYGVNVLVSSEKSRYPRLPLGE